MTELTNTPQRQSSDPMHSDSATGDIRPDPKRRRTRRRRWYLLAAIPVMLLTLMVILSSPRGSCTLIGIEPGYSWVSFDLSSFDLSPVLAHAALPVQVRACVRERYSTSWFALPEPTSTCASFTVDQRGFAIDGRGSDHDLDPLGLPNVVLKDHDLDPWSLPEVLFKEPSLSWEEPIAFRLNVSQSGNSIIDSSAAVLSHKDEINGPPLSSVAIVTSMLRLPSTCVSVS
jgi:hypothetical protein